MNEFFEKHIKVNLKRIIPEQRYINGHPVFNESAIGKVFSDSMIAKDENAAIELIEHWNKTSPYHYEIVDILEHNLKTDELVHGLSYAYKFQIGRYGKLEKITL